MPGLNGIVGPRFDAGLQDLSQTMLRRMCHHNWYQIDEYCDSASGAALARVSLGFLQTASQPVWNQNRSVCLFMDGEIFGATEIRRTLATAGCHVSNDASHAELLLQGYLWQGQRFFRDLNGAFVAAIWDAPARRLTLVNDRFGMKPLYYAHLPNRLLFAAEIKSLLADPALPREPHPRGIAQFFSFGQLLCEDTMLAAVKMLPPAAWVTFDQAANRLELNHYWQLSDIRLDPGLSQDEFLERIDAAFHRAMQLQTSDSQALGISLSGGLDSRTILALIDHQHVPIKSVSMGMQGSLDHCCAKQMADLTNRDHHCCLLGQQFLVRYSSTMRQMVHLTDGHYLDQCIVLPTLPKYRELGIQVLLRGHAGELMHMDKAYNFSLNAQGWAIQDETSLRTWLNAHSRAYMLDGLTAPLLTGVSSAELQSLADNSLNNALAPSQGVEPALHRIWHLFITQRLRRETAMSMAKIGTLMETRLPFLDNGVVETLLSAPPQWKRGEEIQSFILRRRRPEFLSVVNANTGAPMGAGRWRREAARFRARVFAKLGVPGYQPYERLGLWLRRELRPWVHQVLLSPRTLERGVFDPQTVRKVVLDHGNRRHNHTALLLALLIFELGQREFIDGEDISPVSEAGHAVTRKSAASSLAPANKKQPYPVP